MTDFRRVRCLHAYSGGTVPDSNRVHYSPPIPVEISGTQMQYSITLQYNTEKCVCQSFGKCLRDSFDLLYDFNTFFKN